MTRYENLTLDEERALYGIHGAVVENCTFDGPADGESALKECGDIAVYNCDMRLRYPLWHVHRAELKDVRMTDTCRAALWYDSDVTIKDSKLHGIKALRECDRSYPHRLRHHLARVRLVRPRRQHPGLHPAGGIRLYAQPGYGHQGVTYDRQVLLPVCPGRCHPGFGAGHQGRLLAQQERHRLRLGRQGGNTSPGTARG